MSNTDDTEAVSQPGGWASLIMATVCGTLAAFSVAVVIFSGMDVSQCASGLGQLSGALSTARDSQCSGVLTVHGLAEVVALITGAGFVLATVAHLRRG